jgi:hypothetical protein
MVREKIQFNLTPSCIKFIILFIIFISGFYLFYTWLLLLFYFSIEKAKRWLKVLWLSDIFLISWLQDCLKTFITVEIIGNIKKTKKDKKSIKKNKKIKNTKVLWKKEKVKKYKWQDYSLTTKKTNSKNTDKSMNTWKYSSNLVKNKTFPTSQSLKSSKYSFNNWKSIWDDYESVLDIMSKNKK